MMASHMFQKLVQEVNKMTEKEKIKDLKGEFDIDQGSERQQCFPSARDQARGRLHQQPNGKADCLSCPSVTCSLPRMTRLSMPS